MASPVKVAEERFADARELAAKLVQIMDILSFHLGLNSQPTPVTYVKTWEPGCPDEGCDGDCTHSPYAQIVRLWEYTLTDGSKVYEVHIA